MRKLLVFLVFLISVTCFGQIDTLVLKNKDVIIGEVKTLNNNVLTMETSYSDKDFQIEFDKVVEMRIQRNCIISLTKGRRRYGHIRSEEPGTVTINTEEGTTEKVPIDQVLALQEIEDKFWSRFKGSIDLGFNLTKANNNRQLTLDTRLSYSGEYWLIKAGVNLLSSDQDDVEETRRVDGNLEIFRILSNDWYIAGEVTLLRNTEQALDARISPTIGGGKFLVNNNKMYLSVGAGLVYNVENYVDESLDKTSTEILLGANINLFNIKDFSLTSGIKSFPSLSESGRFRTDYTLNLKYDLPLDFYIKAGLTINYDNQPAVEGNDFDYIVTTGFGWEFND